MEWIGYTHNALFATHKNMVAIKMCGLEFPIKLRGCNMLIGSLPSTVLFRARVTYSIIFRQQKEIAGNGWEMRKECNKDIKIFSHRKGGRSAKPLNLRAEDNLVTVECFHVFYGLNVNVLRLSPSPLVVVAVVIRKLLSQAILSLHIFG